MVVAAGGARSGARTARRRRTSTRAIVYAVLGLIVLIPGCALAFYGVEHGHNDQVKTVGSAFRWASLTLLEDQSPFDANTDPGTVITYFMLIGGLVFITVATASVATKLVELVLNPGDGKVKTKVKRHIVICGWSAKGEDILRELHLQADADRHVVVLAPLAESPNPGVTFVKGHPTREDDLLRAGLDRADTAIVLADDSNPSANPDDVDARTLLTALAVETLNPAVYSCVEVLRAQNRHHFLRTQADELIVSDEMTGALIANSAVTHGLSRVVADLMTHSEGNEFKTMAVPSEVANLPFADAVAALKRSANCVLFAVAKRDGDYEINPDADRLIAADDRLLVIAPGATMP